VTDAERHAALDAIGAEVRICTRCRLSQGRTKAVPGEGHPGTEVMFVGEGPGFNEDQQGRPFVGRAGDLLEKLLASIDWKRDEVFIANVVKCRPPDNRDPEPDEIAACAPYLTRQLEVLDPALVVTLGRFSMARFNPGAKISQVHGTYKPADPNSGAPEALAFFMYHPAAALRTTAVENQSYQDIARVPMALTESRARRAARATTFPRPEAAPLSPPSPVADELPAPQPSDVVVDVAPPSESASQPQSTSDIKSGPAGAPGIPGGTAAAAPTVEQPGQSDPAGQLGLF
jgi:DNA polymerase